MAEASEERSNSVIETSLTELAFIFFFILLTVSAWKISTASEKLEESKREQQALDERISDLSESLAVASEVFASQDEFDPEELFQELKAGRKAQEQLDQAVKEKSEMEDRLSELTKIIPENLSKDDLHKQLNEYREVVQLMEDYDDGLAGKPMEAMADLIQEYNDAKGQNLNLRNKLESVGNGLDHPPCWADPNSGDIQYVFDVIINEEFVEIKAGWPDSRDLQARNNPNISKVPGSYSSNPDLWLSTGGLFDESVDKNCRHFVRVYDHAESKKSFKYYLLGIENHFYKFLSSRRYQ